MMDDILYGLALFFIGWFTGVIAAYYGMKMRFREMDRIIRDMNDYTGWFIKVRDDLKELVSELRKLTEEFNNMREYIHDMNIRLDEVEEKVDALRTTVDDVYNIMEKKFKWNVNIELKTNGDR